MWACGTTGHATGTTTIKPPFVDPITITFGISNDGTTFTASGGSGHANKCVQLTWSDAEGNTIGTTTVQTDGSGGASGQVPPGAVRWQADVVDCPEQQPVDPVPQGAAAQGAITLPAKEHLIQGGPIVPSDAAGEKNLTYCFIVKATSTGRAKALVEPIIVGGMGTPVPASVKVISFATMETDAFGARFVQAQPGQFLSWSLDFNQGAFYADLNTALNYQLNGWDVVEAAIPMSAFDFGVVPGVTYSNSGTAAYSTDLLAEPVTGAYTYSFSF